MKTVYIYAQDTLADLEAGYAMAELLRLKTCALSREPVTTMGGLRILPDLTVDEICLVDAAMLILPGGDGWLKCKNEMILERAAAFLAAEIPLAAMALGRVGLLSHHHHTSNELEFLRMVCGDAYTGSALYEEQPAVLDGNLITAARNAPLEFACRMCFQLKL